MKNQVTKCPKCWAEKAFLDERNDWKYVVLSYLFVVPMKCHHCFHTFNISWFSTFRRQLNPPATAQPVLRVVESSDAPHGAVPTADSPPMIAGRIEPAEATIIPVRRAA